MSAAQLLRNRIAALALAAAGLAPLPARADDTALFSTSYPPNVLLFVDNSGSMNTIMYHPAFVIDDYPFSCDIITAADYGTGGYFNLADDNGDNVKRYAGDGPAESSIDIGKTDSGFVSTPTTGHADNGYITRTFCGQTRRLYVDGRQWQLGNRTWYQEEYIEWYFSLDPSDTATTYGPAAQTAAQIITEIEDSANGRKFIDGAYFGKYQRTRIAAARDIADDVIYQTNTDCPAYGGDCGVYYDRVRFGLAQFQRFSEGGFVRVGIDAYSVNKSNLESAIDALDARTATPLGETLFKLYTYFLSRTSTNRPYGAIDTTERFPVYSYRNTDGYPVPTYSGTVPGDPVQERCQKNFIIMITDGEPTSDNFAHFDDNWTKGFDKFASDYIGDYAPDASGDPDIGTDGTPEVGSPPWTSSDSAGYLDDIAKFIQDTDMRLDFTGKQTIDIYTVGFNTRGPVNTLLQKTASHGNGLNFIGNQSETLTQALVDSIADIIVKSQSFTAATVPASRATDGNNFFASYFVPGENDPYWEGHLKLFEYNALGEIHDKPVPPATEGECALDDPLAPTRCLAGRLKVELGGYWDAANEIPAPNSRTLYTSLYSTGRPSTIPSAPVSFTTSLTTGDLNFPTLGITTSVISQYGVAGSTSGITTLNGLRSAIVRYVRGCNFSSSSTCTDRGDGKKLWDIFHSNPLVVGPPNAGLNALSYREFVDKYGHRKRVIYAGSNGGFVHGFNAGEWDSVAGEYNRGTGAEQFGFMAWPARKTIANLPRDVSRTWYYMDGSPQAADVWLYPDPEVQPGDATAWNDWRTVLLGGMRQGGRALWALDVTNPPDTANPSGVTGGPAYPRYMWEFPCESTEAECVGTGVVPSGRTLLQYMGQTWSEPIVTKVKVTVDCSSNCETFDRWVAIFGAGYDPLGDPNLAHNSATGSTTRATATVAADYDASADTSTSRAGRAVFMVDIATGEVLAMQRYDHSATDGNTEMKYAFTATPSVFDLNADGYADVVYFGDLGGNLWKWVITAAVPDPINGTGNVLQPTWPFIKLMTADGCAVADGCTSPHFRSFFFPPQGALVGADLWLALGSGERTNLPYIGTDDDEKNRYYVFRDIDPLERELTAPTPPASRYTDASPSTDFVNVSTLSGTCVKPPAPAIGYYIEGEQGEKFITETEIFFGVVLTGSYKPTASASGCDVGGEARLYGFKLFCGEGIFPPAGVGPNRRYLDIGGGLPNRPRVSVGPVDGGGGGGGPCSDMVVVITSEGEAYTDCPGGRPSSGIHVKSWRDL